MSRWDDRRRQLRRRRPDQPEERRGAGLQSHRLLQDPRGGRAGLVRSLGAARGPAGGAAMIRAQHVFQGATLTVAFAPKLYGLTKIYGNANLPSREPDVRPHQRRQPPLAQGQRRARLRLQPGGAGLAARRRAAVRAEPDARLRPDRSSAMWNGPAAIAAALWRTPWPTAARPDALPLLAPPPFAVSGTDALPQRPVGRVSPTPRPRRSPSTLSTTCTRRGSLRPTGGLVRARAAAGLRRRRALVHPKLRLRSAGADRAPGAVLPRRPPGRLRPQPGALRLSSARDLRDGSAIGQLVRRLFPLAALDAGPAWPASMAGGAGPTSASCRTDGSLVVRLSRYF